MRLTYLVVLLLAFCVGAASVAAAATLGVSSRSLGGGTAAVDACDTDGIVFSGRALDSTASHNVTSLTVSSIAAACAGSTLTVTLANASNAALATASTTLPSSGFTGTATVAFSGSTPAGSITSYRVAIVGS